jgi:hypothetical protein
VETPRPGGQDADVATLVDVPEGAGLSVAVGRADVSSTVPPPTNGP